MPGVEIATLIFFENWNRLLQKGIAPAKFVKVSSSIPILFGRLKLNYTSCLRYNLLPTIRA